MARYLGPRLRIIRRLGKLRGFTRKNPFRRLFTMGRYSAPKVDPPGQHGVSKLFKSSNSEYLIRLKVKQRLRYNYGIGEKQLINYVRKAKKSKESTGQVLLQLLEMRLDNTVFRLNMAPTIVAARQMISHGHICVNQKKVNIASYMCKPKDVISVTMKPSSLKLVHKNMEAYYKKMRFYKKRVEKTLAYLLVKFKITSTIANAMQLIQNGKVQVNNYKVTKPNFICSPKNTLSIFTEKGVIKFKLNQNLEKVSLRERQVTNQKGRGAPRP